MKKILPAVLCLSLCACSGQKTSSVSESTPEPEPETVWISEPKGDYSSVQPAMALTQIRLQAHTENFGDVSLFVETPVSGNPGDWQAAGYSSNAVLVTKANKQGISDYEGNEVYPMTLNAVDSPYSEGLVEGYTADGTPVLGLISVSSSSVHVLSKDYKEVQELPVDQFSYDDRQAFERDFSNGTRCMLAVKEGQLGILGRVHTDSIANADTVFEPYTEPLPSNVIVPVIGAGHAAESYVLCDTSGAVIMELPGGPDYGNGTYINDHYMVKEGNYYNIFDAKTGQSVANGYQAAGYYNDGYIPVEAYGRWGYLDLSGKPVTDFIFDGASSLYDGKAWVSYQGAWGVIDVKGSLDQGKQISLSSIDPCSEEEKGKIQVMVSDLQIHTGASSASSLLGNSLSGDIYPYYETSEAEGYTWYRIGENAWIANDGTWGKEVTQ
jgi:hypothetical protein